MEKREAPYTVGGNVSWYNDGGKQFQKFLKKLKLELPYGAALLGTYLEKTIIQKDTCTPNVHCSIVYSSQDVEAT